MALKDKVTALFGGITSASREVIRPVMKRFNTLYFYNTQYEGGVCDRNTFCTGQTPAQNVDKLVPYITKRWGKKIYIVAADYNYGQITTDWIKKYAAESGATVVGTDFFPAGRQPVRPDHPENPGRQTGHGDLGAGGRCAHGLLSAMGERPA